jgi:hypothetical protein
MFRVLSPVPAALLGAAAIAIPAAPLQAQPASAQERGSLSEYMMDPSAEIALARSSAPKSISDQAEIRVLTSKGYEVAVKGTNGWTCWVDRSWTQKFDAPVFWNPRGRAPGCVNAAAAHTVLPLVSMRTQWVLAGMTPQQMAAAAEKAVEAKAIPPVEPGAMAYMLSKDQYLSDAEPHNLAPHVMFYFPLAEEKTWGAGAPDSVIYVNPDLQHPEGIAVVIVPMRRWSDGTSSMPEGAEHAHKM